jgi:glycosyltransferase involved in cell wall biosynthesis
MRVLVVTSLYPNPFQPHLATFNREQVRALARDHQVVVISPIPWTVEFAARRAGSPALPPGRRMEWDGLPVEYPRLVFIPRTMRSWYGRCCLWSLRRSFARAIESFKPDVVLATWAYPDGWATVRLARQAGLPVVLKVHGSDVLQLDVHPGRRRGTVEAIRGADLVVAVSRDLARKVVEFGADPERVHLIYNGVDAAVFRPGDRAEARRQVGIDPDRPALLYVGNLVSVKGPDLLIEACAGLAERGAEFDLHVIGKGPLRPTLERQAQGRGIGPRVRFHGPMDHGRLPGWFRAADLLVLPSRSEGVPNVLLEASACGTPFVATAVGGVPEVAHLGAGRLVPPGDPMRLADAITELLDNPPPPSGHVVGRTHADAAGELAAVLAQTIRPGATAPPTSQAQQRGGLTAEARS